MKKLIQQVRWLISTKKYAACEFRNGSFLSRFLLVVTYSVCSKNLKNYDAVVVVTDHDFFDYQLIKKNSDLIIDTRGRFNISHNIIRA